MRQKAILSSSPPWTAPDGLKGQTVVKATGNHPAFGVSFHLDSYDDERTLRPRSQTVEEREVACDKTEE
ncbi:hypothetical protein Nepgr_009630 [Nepenthes gracilis]|uniref:Uncharacterized protein n=1 Tax=Nepenthes gracilis TaxID=150966 RepID=A0AAD3SAW9_NEPGR|nr:hypothetical protein Nepgr_009630 [Nepenthes gracilis]